MRTTVHYIYDEAIVVSDHTTREGHPSIPRKNEEVWINGSGYSISRIQRGICTPRHSEESNTCLVSIYLEKL